MVKATTIVFVEVLKWYFIHIYIVLKPLQYTDSYWPFLLLPEVGAGFTGGAYLMLERRVMQYSAILEKIKLEEQRKRVSLAITTTGKGVRYYDHSLSFI